MPLLVVVCGLPGSGKSTFARRLAKRLDAEWISSDVLRTEAGLLGDYRAASIERVYAAMHDRAAACLARGRSTVLDGSFSSRRYREMANAAAAAAGARFALIQMTVAEETALARVSRKRRVTEAGPEAYRLLKSRFDPIEGECLRLDTTRSQLGKLLGVAVRYLSTAER